MSNLISAINDGVSEGGIDRVAQLTESLNLQVGNLTSLGGSLSGLMSEPNALSGLVRSLDEMELPGFDIGSDLPNALNGLQQALPSDVGDVLGPLLSGMDELEGSVIGQLANVVAQSLEAALAIYKLTQLRFGAATVTGAQASSSEAEDGGNGGGEPAEGGGDESPTDVQSTAAALNSIDRVLDLFPAQADVKSVLTLLASVGAKRSQLPFKLPVFDELGDLIETLLAWEGLDAADVHSQLEATMGDLTSLLQSGPQNAFAAVENELAPVQGALRVSDLQQIADTLQTQFTAISEAIISGDLSGTGAAVSALNSACDLQGAVAADWAGSVQAQLVGWLQRLAALPENLEDQLEQRVHVLRPVGMLDHVLDLSLPEGWARSQAAIDEFGALLDRYVAWLWDLVNRIDLQAIEEPLEAVADGARAAVDSLDDAMVSVTMQVQALFGKAEALIDQVNPEAVTGTVVSAIDEFGDDLTQQLQKLTQPIRDAVDTLITELQGSLSSFDPGAVKDACQQVIDALSGALSNESLQNAAESIKNAIDNAATQIEQLSFAPVTDQVIAAIEEVTEALRSIDASQLDPILRGALDAAVAVLPSDIAALTDPLIDELGRLIEEEAPMPQLAEVLDKPQQALDFVRQYEPQALLGTALSEPFEALLAELRAFQPSRMLREPLEQVLVTLKDRLRAHANPAQLLDPLIPLFDELMAEINALDPAVLIEPLETRLQELIDSLLEALRIDEVMNQVDAVLNKIQEVIDIGDHARAILLRLSDVLEGLLDAEAQFNAWLSPILDKLQLSDTGGPLTTAQDNLVAAVDGLRAADLQARFDDATTSILNDLEAIGADQLLVPAIQAFRAIPREPLEAIAGFAAEKAALLAVLDRCNPIQSEFAAPFQGLADFTRGLRAAQLAIGEKLGDWDTRWHTSDQPLAELRTLAVTGDTLRSQFAESLASQLVQPFVGIFDMAGPLRDALVPVLDNLERMVTLLQSKLDAAILGPDALGGIRNAMDELIERIRNFNLAFLRESLQSLFDNVNGKLETLSPQTFRDAVDAEFGQLLDALSLDLILPSQDPDPLDQTFSQLVDDFAKLHPDDLLVQPMQTSFEQDVLPLLEAFDLTPVVQGLLDRLASLDDELKEEMQRVNGAYNGLLQAIP